MYEVKKEPKFLPNFKLVSVQPDSFHLASLL